MVVIPCMTPLGSEKTQNSIDFQEIKPLVVENLVVKAKKPKKVKAEEQEQESQKLQVEKKDEDEV